MKKLLNRQDYDKWFEKHKDKCLLCQPEKQILIQDFMLWSWIVNIGPYRKYHTMLVPKRHIKYLSEVDGIEFAELTYIYDEIMDRYRKAELMENGKPVIRFLITIRARYSDFDYEGKTNARPEHLHIHFFPDSSKLLDPILDPEASKIDLDKFIKALLK